MTDDDKIRLQFALDTKEFGKQVKVYADLLEHKRTGASHRIPIQFNTFKHFSHLYYYGLLFISQALCPCFNPSFVSMFQPKHYCPQFSLKTYKYIFYFTLDILTWNTTGQSSFIQETVDFCRKCQKFIKQQ